MITKPSQLAFDIDRGIAHKETGMEAAEDARTALLEEARVIARELGQRKGLVTADDVYRVMVARDLPIEALGPAAGSIFRGKNWTFTGQWKKSVRVSNHARMIRVWAYQPRV